MPVEALMDTVQRFRSENHLPYSNLTLQSDPGSKLINVVATTFQTSKEAARVRLLKRGLLLDMGTQRTEELF